MIKSELVARACGFFFFYRWHPEVALRYLPVVDKIKKIDNRATVLEVGSGSLGIAPYLRRRITGVDTNFEGPFHPQLLKVKGTVTKLPFARNSYDIVISVDMLEHIKPLARKKAISEMIRVAKKMAVIAVPCGSESEKEDATLLDEYRRIYQKGYRFMSEQVTLGLPNEGEMIDMIRQTTSLNKKNADIDVEGNETIALHRFLMRGWMNPHLLAQLFFRKILLLGIPLMRQLNGEPTYRKIFTVNIKHL